MLIERYSAQISGMSFRYFRNEDDVKDFSSELFLKLSDKLRVLELREGEDFGRWMVRFVRNAIIDQLRSKHSRDRHQEQFGLQAVLSEEQSHDFEADSVGLALKQLSEQERTCIEAIYLQETSYQDIMQEHGYTFNQVRGYRDRGIRKLRELLSDTNSSKKSA